MPRARAVECKVCGSKELHCGSYCKKHYIEKKKVYNNNYANSAENKAKAKERIENKKIGISNRPSVVMPEVIHDISNFKEFQRPDGSIYRAIAPISSCHTQIS